MNYRIKFTKIEMPRHLETKYCSMIKKGLNIITITRRLSI